MKRIDCWEKLECSLCKKIFGVYDAPDWVNPICLECANKEIEYET